MVFMKNIYPSTAGRLAALALGVGLYACGGQDQAGSQTEAKLVADADNGGISLAEGFRALVVADSLGEARHLVAAPNGDLYVMLRQPNQQGHSIVALRDSTGDGKADRIESFGEYSGTGIELYQGHLYFSSDTAVWRYPMAEGQLVPTGSPELMVTFPRQDGHEAKPMTFDAQGNMYVNVGAPSNACQKEDRVKGSPAMDPCPILEKHGGIWRFSATQPGQAHGKDGYRYATGIRNAVALRWNPAANQLYALQHGRDQLHTLYPDLFTVEQNAELPSEEFMLLRDQSDFGWPYCYNDHQQGKKVTAPEYGGDGKKIDRCEGKDKPIYAFPGHWAPNDLIFYQGAAFPEKYRNGAFIAFHGSWNRAPVRQAGYKVVFVPMKGELPAGEPEVFADKFTGVDTLASPGDARFRPCGLATGPDGSLYIADSRRGRIWRVVYADDRKVALAQ
jgi:glucose/arabinose dehydrogenase